MPRIGPISRRNLIFYLGRLGFAGPYPRAKHAYMIRGETRVTIPNPHRGDIGVGLLRAILREADISKQEWEQL